MKNKHNFIGLTAILGIIVLGFIACDTGNTSSHRHAPGAAATCTSEQICTECGAVIIAALGHSYVWVETTPLIETGICSVCSNPETRSAIESKMVKISAGTNITMTNYLNSSDSYIVNLSSFKISKYQVTQAQYEELIGTNPSYFHGGAGRKADGIEDQVKRPVEQVSWYDAVEFCNELSDFEGLTAVYSITNRTPPIGNPITSAIVTADFSKTGYRLPTEAEWEYACKAGTTTMWIHGNAEANLGEYAWYDPNSNSKTHEVGRRTANAWGLHDMHGNVWEWCWDWYDTYPGESKTNYSGAVSGLTRVVRGGGWDVLAEYTGSSTRYVDYPDYTNYNLGFRLVRP